MADKEKGNPLLKYVRFTGMGLQMGLTIWVGSLIGAWLDRKFGIQNELFYKGVSLFAIFGSIFSFIRQVMKISNEK